jgi:hypothetical protein
MTGPKQPDPRLGAAVGRRRGFTRLPLRCPECSHKAKTSSGGFVDAVRCESCRTWLYVVPAFAAGTGVVFVVTLTDLERRELSNSHAGPMEILERLGVTMTAAPPKPTPEAA